MVNLKRCHQNDKLKFKYHNVTILQKCMNMFPNNPYLNAYSSISEINNILSVWKHMSEFTMEMSFYSIYSNVFYAKGFSVSYAFKKLIRNIFHVQHRSTKMFLLSAACG